jgi:hypothetical protein
MAGGVFSTAKLHGMTIRESATDGSDFTNPDADYRRLFLGEDGELHVKDSAGAVTTIGASGVGNITGSAAAKCSSAVTLTTSLQDITGATLTIVPAVAEIWIVTSIWDFFWSTANAGNVAVGSTVYDGVQETPQGTFQGNVVGRATVAQVHRIAATAASHTIKLQAQKTGASGVASAEVHSQIMVLRYVA